MSKGKEKASLEPWPGPRTEPQGTSREPWANSAEPGSKFPEQ